MRRAGVVPGESRVAGIHPESDKDFARQMFVDFDEELDYWRDNYASSCFHRDGMEFRDYEAAVKLGINVFLRSHGRSFDELKEQLAESYERTRGNSLIEWPEASVAAGAAWQRMADRLASRISFHANRRSAPALPDTARPGRAPAATTPQAPP